MFSQTVEYALRAVTWLGHSRGVPQTTRHIAEATRVPAGYLSKVLQALGRAGIVRSQRGLHGGFTLVREPDQIAVLDVINAVDPIRRIRQCPLGLKTHGARLCPLHRQLDDAIALIEKAFANSTIAGILTEPTRRPPVCGIRVKQTNATRRRSGGKEK